MHVQGLIRTSYQTGIKTSSLTAETTVELSGTNEDNTDFTKIFQDTIEINSIIKEIYQRSIVIFEIAYRSKHTRNTNKNTLEFRILK